MHDLFGLRKILDDCDELVTQIDQECYTMPLSILGGATVGQHLRHIIEFYHCIYAGYDDAIINYNDRKRDLTLEISMEDAFHALKDVVCQLENCDAQKIVQVIHEGNDQQMGIPSSLARELMYGHDHSVHHYAIIKMALRAHYDQVELPLAFGVAPSTLKYQSQSKKV